MSEPKSPPRSLVQRIMLSFALLTTLVGTLYSYALYHSIEYTETHLIAAVLQDEADLALANLESGLTPLLPEGTTLYGESPLPAVPPAFRGLPEGFSELTDEGDWFIYVTQKAGKTYVLARDQKGFEDTEREFQRIVLLSLLLVSLLGLAAGWWLSRNIMRPVRDLSAAVKRASTSTTYQPLSVSVTNDEVGELARICDSALYRLHDALIREKAFTGDVSHELRTPLTVIETSCELLAMTPMTDAQTKQVERISRASADMRELMKLFLAFARTSEAGAQGVPDTMSGILETVVNTWEPFAAEKGLKLVFRREGQAPGGYSPVMLGTVANNLLKNAVAYTEAGSVVVTETDEGFTVCDTGPGLTSDDLQSIFRDGFRGQASKGKPGSGLGLAIVSRICRRSGWTITAGSPASGVGAAFTVKTKAASTARADRL